MWKIDLTQMQQYHETLVTHSGQVTYRRGRVKEGNKELEYG
jgi:hypothetical protein